MVEHRSHTPRVAGSNPAHITKQASVAQRIRAFRYGRKGQGFESSRGLHAAVAQLVEHGIEDPGVGGSIPSCGTIILTRGKRLSRWVVAPEKIVRFYPSGPNKYSKGFNINYG